MVQFKLWKTIRISDEIKVSPDRVFEHRIQSCKCLRYTNCLSKKYPMYTVNIVSGEIKGSVKLKKKSSLLLFHVNFRRLVRNNFSLIPEKYKILRNKVLLSPYTPS